MQSTLLIIQTYSSIVMLFMWLLQVKSKDATPVDLAWSGMIFLSTLVCFINIKYFDLRHFVIAILSMFWSLKMSIYLFIRIIKSHVEDSRYYNMRKCSGKYQHLVFFIFYQVQAVFVTMFMVPILIALQTTATAFNLTDFIAILVYVVAIIGELTADIQLMKFKQQKTGLTCQVGLWSLSRHPNYFFEWIGWFSYPLFSINSSMFLISLMYPFIILFFLFKLTGITHVERESIKNKSDYAKYIETTSKFIPWPRKQNKK